MSFSITIDAQSESPIEVNVHHGRVQQHHAAAAAPIFPPALPAAAQAAPKEGGFSLKEVSLILTSAPVYCVLDSLLKGSSEIDTRILIGGAALAAIGTAAAYSPTVRRVLTSGVSLGCTAAKGVGTQAWNWGIAAPFNAARNYGGAALGVGARTLSAIGKISTTAVAGAIKVASSVVAETGKFVGTTIESVGNIAPVLTGAAVTGAVCYFGRSYLGQE